MKEWEKFTIYQVYNLDCSYKYFGENEMKDNIKCLRFQLREFKAYDEEQYNRYLENDKYIEELDLEILFEVEFRDGKLKIPYNPEIKENELEWDDESFYNNYEQTDAWNAGIEEEFADYDSAKKFFNKVVLEEEKKDDKQPKERPNSGNDKEKLKENIMTEDKMIKIAKKKLNLKIDDNAYDSADIYALEEVTVDGYTIYVVTYDMKSICISEDVYYYDSDVADAIMERIKNCNGQCILYADNYFLDSIYFDDHMVAYFEETINEILEDNEDMKYGLIPAEIQELKDKYRLDN